MLYLVNRRHIASPTPVYPRVRFTVSYELSVRNWNPITEGQSISALENKVACLKSIVGILKSEAYIPRSPLKQRLYALEHLFDKYTVHVIYDAFNIFHETFYNHVLRNKKNNT